MSSETKTAPVKLSRYGLRIKNRIEKNDGEVRIYFKSKDVFFDNGKLQSIPLQILTDNGKVNPEVQYLINLTRELRKPICWVVQYNNSPSGHERLLQKNKVWSSFRRDEDNLLVRWDIRWDTDLVNFRELAFMFEFKKITIKADSTIIDEIKGQLDISGFCKSELEFIA